MSRKGRKSRRGAAAVEFALILPVLLAILLGIMDWGWVFYVQLSMTNAAREGARVGITEDTPADAQTSAVTVATSYLTRAGLAAAVSATAPDPAGDPTVLVTVSVNPFTPLVGFVPTPGDLNATAAMRWELAE